MQPIKVSGTSQDFSQSFLLFKRKKATPSSNPEASGFFILAAGSDNW